MFLDHERLHRRAVRPTSGNRWRPSRLHASVSTSTRSPAGGRGGQTTSLPSIARRSTTDLAPRRRNFRPPPLAAFPSLAGRERNGKGNGFRRDRSIDASPPSSSALGGGSRRATGSLPLPRKVGGRATEPVGRDTRRASRPVRGPSRLPTRAEGRVRNPRDRTANGAARGSVRVGHGAVEPGTGRVVRDDRGRMEADRSTRAVRLRGDVGIEARDADLGDLRSQGRTPSASLDRGFDSPYLLLDPTAWSKPPSRANPSSSFHRRRSFYSHERTNPLGGPRTGHATREDPLDRPGVRGSRRVMKTEGMFDALR